MASKQIFVEDPDNWYSLFVKTGVENNILDKLANLKIDTLQYHVPKRELKIRQGGSYHIEIKTMFPGYILVHGQLTIDSYSRIKQINDVYTWIHDENGPLQISPKEIIILESLLDRQDVIRMSKVFYMGDKIIIMDGPLIGKEGIIRRVDKRNGRAKIALSMFGDERLIDISVDNISGMDEESLINRISLKTAVDYI